MADQTDEPGNDETEAKPKKGKGLIFGLLGAVVLGAGGFYASSSGLLPFLGGSKDKKQAAVQYEAMVAGTATEFVAIDRMVISLGSGSSSRHLNFGAALEVDPISKEEVVNLMPRILDVLNTYLRAVEPQDIEAPSAMTRLRGQMLRRVNLVAGDGLVKDLLITEFVLN